MASRKFQLHFDAKDKSTRSSRKVKKTEINPDFSNEDFPSIGKPVPQASHPKQAWGSQSKPQPSTVNKRDLPRTEPFPNMPMDDAGYWKAWAYYYWDLNQRLRQEIQMNALYLLDMDDRACRGLIPPPEMFE